jgi:FkbM family methyltransferase
LPLDNARSFISRFFHRLLNWYVGLFNFPHAGWKYFRSFLQAFALDKRSYQKRLSGGQYINVRPVDHIQKDLFWYGHYELNSINLLIQLIEKDSIVIDIGANIGYYTIVAASRTVSGHVYAFEPLSFLCKEIEKNVLLNCLHNVKVNHSALGSREQDSIAYLSSEDNIGMSGLVPAENFSGKTEAVHSTTLDKWKEIEKIKRIDIIKIDVEGGELDVLSGMRNTLAACRPIMLIEVIEHQLERFGASIEELYSFVRSYNYNAFDIVGKNVLQEITGCKESYSVLFMPRERSIPNGITVVRSN